MDDDGETGDAERPPRVGRWDGMLHQQPAAGAGDEAMPTAAAMSRDADRALPAGASEDGSGAGNDDDGGGTDGPRHSGGGEAGAPDGGEHEGEEEEDETEDTNGEEQLNYEYDAMIDDEFELDHEDEDGDSGDFDGDMEGRMEGVLPDDDTHSDLDDTRDTQSALARRSDEGNADSEHDLSTTALADTIAGLADEASLRRSTRDEHLVCLCLTGTTLLPPLHVCTQLRVLHLVNCGIRAVQPALLAAMPHLRTLSLKSNALEKLDSLSLASSAPMLIELMVDFNPLTSLPTPGGPSSLPESLEKLSVCGAYLHDLWKVITVLCALPRLKSAAFQDPSGRPATGHHQCRDNGPVRIDGCQLHQWHTIVASAISVVYARTQCAHSSDRCHRTADAAYCVAGSAAAPANGECGCGRTGRLGAAGAEPAGTGDGVQWMTAQEGPFEVSHTRHRRRSPYTGEFRDNVNQICRLPYYTAILIHCVPQIAVLDGNVISAERRALAAFQAAQVAEVQPVHSAPSLSVTLAARETSSCVRSTGRAAGATVWRQALSDALNTRLVQPRSTARLQWTSVCPGLMPRQCEYSPAMGGVLAVGTLHGDVCAVDVDACRLAGNGTYGARIWRSATVIDSSPVMALAWMRSSPDLLVAGHQHGTIAIHSINVGGDGRSLRARHFANFGELTAVSINSTDSLLVASGTPRFMALYDIATQRLLCNMCGCHRASINVIRFAYHTESLLASCSIDRHVRVWDLRQGHAKPVFDWLSQRENIVVSFAPDDMRVLASATDAEIRQFDLRAPTRPQLMADFALGSRSNHTRAYYMNGGKHVISGSCLEQRVRVFSAQTGRLVRDVPLYDCVPQQRDFYVQSLRGDRLRDWRAAVLTCNQRGHLMRSEVTEINLAACSPDA